MELREKENNKLSNFICLDVIFIFLVNIFPLIAITLSIQENIFSLVLKVILGFFFAMNLPIIFRHFDIKIIFFVVLSCVITLFQFLLFPSLNIFFKNTALSFWTLCFLPSICIYLIDDYNVLMKKLEKSSTIITLIFLVFIILKISGVIQTGFDNYSMGLGYSCLIPALILLHSYFESNKLTKILAFFILVIGIVLIGSRGPLLGIILFLLYEIIRSFFNRKKSFSQFLSSFFLITFCSFLMFFYKDILIYFSDFLKSNGTTSRTLNMLIADADNSTGRDKIYELLIMNIKESPFVVRGINSDYVLLDGIYAHNIVLEIIYDFGIIIGGIILLFLFFNIIKTLFKIPTSNGLIICCILMFASIPKLFISSTLWEEYSFWMWLMICLKFNLFNFSIQKVGELA